MLQPKVHSSCDLRVLGHRLCVRLLGQQLLVPPMNLQESIGLGSKTGLEICILEETKSYLKQLDFLETLSRFHFQSSTRYQSA